MLSVKSMIFCAFRPSALCLAAGLLASASRANATWFDPQSTCEKLLLSKSEIPLAIHKLNYRVFGDPKKPALVLIHGLDGAWQTFANVTEALAQDHYVIAYDQRGHGQSAEGGPSFFSEVMARDLLALLDHLHVPQAHILGHSLGARTATRFAEMYPQRVRSLIIEDMEMRNRYTYTREEAARVLAQVERLGRIPRFFESREALVDALTPLFGRERTEFTLERGTTVHADGTYELKVRPAVSALYVWQANLEDLRAAFAGVRAPTLVLRANPDDSEMSPEGFAEMQAARPEADFVDLALAGHSMHRTDEAGFLRAVKTFLAKVESNQR